MLQKCTTSGNKNIAQIVNLWMSIKLCIFRGITWPLDSHAGLDFRSAHFATYCMILSVNFKPLCIGPIMSAKADKGDRKREIE